MKRTLLPLVLMSMVLAAASALAAEPLATLDIWPDKVPGETGEVGEEKLLPQKDGQTRVERLTNVTRPSIAVYAPDKEKATTTAVVICPGGGYHILAMDLEGREVAAWLNSIGVTGIVLKYRVPARKGQPRHLAPLQDAQRAVSLVRARAKQWNIDPSRIGILGFSAGGHLAATASTNFAQRQYEAVDEIDKTSCRPDFTVLLYPAYLTSGKELSPEVRVTAQTPPTFFLHAGDDRILAENSVHTYLALRQVKVPAELHVFASGGHGFGLRPSSHPCSGWPKLCEQWLQGQGLLGGRP